MRSHLLIGALLFGSVLAAAVRTGDLHASSTRQSDIVFLKEPTLIGGMFVEGPVLITHDDAKMARGEPCTTIYLYEPGKGPVEEIVSFHCIPTPRPIVNTFTIRTRPNTKVGFGCVLTEYQFAGEREGHGVPTPADGN